MQIEALHWDSNFFGLRIGMVRPGAFDRQSFPLEFDNYDLVYLFASPGDPAIPDIENICGQPVDIKLTYRKILHDKGAYPEGVSEYIDKQPNEKLYSLGLQSGVFSRFHTDRRFPAGSFERLYKEWVDRSVDHTLAVIVLIAGYDKGNEQGLVTLQVRGETIAIGLIAVDADARGQGWGTRLIAAAETYAQQHNFHYLQIATQAANQDACRLYVRCGYSVVETTHIYHYWRT